MMYPEALNFEDPALKRAVSRVFPAMKVPEALRNRIVAAMKATEDERTVMPVAVVGNHSPHAIDSASGTMRIHPQAMTTSGWSTMLPGMAIAASMLISIGLMVYFLSSSAQAMPEKFQAAAVARHDGCCKASDHHLPVIRTASYREIGRFLKQELQHPVLAADLTREGWQFSGAAICPISGIATAHLLFRKGSETLSVFSLPAAALPSLTQHQSYRGTTPDGHSIIVRAEDGALYCLVGHGIPGELTVDHLDSIFDKHSSEATVAEATGPRISVAGISREP